MDVPSHDQYGPLYYCWPFVYELDEPTMRSLRIEQSAVPLADIYDLYAKDGITASQVFRWDEELNNSSAEMDDDEDDDEDRRDIQRLLMRRGQLPGELHLVYDLTDTVRVWASHTGRWLSFHIVGEASDDLGGYADWIREHFPVREVVQEKVAFDLMHAGEYGAESYSREIPAPAWEEIRPNYSERVRAELDALCSFKPDEGTAGKIGILLGPPGTGKTHLIRSLAREWKDWANFKYIMDTERFFNDAGYMLEVVLKTASKSKWNVILCEDAEEYIGPRSKGAPALSRLLNMGDGLIGQGLRLILLFTTNAPDAELDEAIKRPGRCFVNAHIPLLTPSEATQWLGQPVGEDISLADLYHRRSATPQIVVAGAARKSGIYL